ncbi:MAG: hypothetical protein ACE5OP_08015 [Candidatus Glassbacteria bacterium]
MRNAGDGIGGAGGPVATRFARLDRDHTNVRNMVSGRHCDGYLAFGDRVSVRG